MKVDLTEMATAILIYSNRSEALVVRRFDEHSGIHLDGWVITSIDYLPLIEGDNWPIYRNWHGDEKAFREWSHDAEHPMAFPTAEEALTYCASHCEVMPDGLLEFAELMKRIAAAAEASK